MGTGESTAEFLAPEAVGYQLEEFLTRLGREVEPLSDNRLVARHRTALVQEERKFKAVSSPTERLLKTATNVLAPTVPFPDDPSAYPDTFYFDDFLDHTIQADRLSEAIKTNPKIQAQREFFVPQHAAVEGETVEESSVDYFRKWLLTDSRLLAVLAPAGYGKTALTCEMSHQLAEDYLTRDSGSAQPFPYVVPFGEFRRLASFEAMILSSLQRQGVTDYTAAAFSYLVERRRVVLMLDGFDELLEERPEEARKNLRELIDQMQGRGKVVVTARSTFFRTSDEVADFLEYGLDSDQVDVIELQSFDKHQRAQVLAKRFKTQKEIASVARFIEAENVSEAMGSPLLLRETIDALTEEDAETRLDRAAGRVNLFEALEHSVYSRERVRHGHLFSDSTQRDFLERLAHALLADNTRGFDFDLVQVLAHEAAEVDEADDSDLAQLADHHFLTVDHESDAARFNHQVFREYFQARAMLSDCASGNAQLVLDLLGRRPVPEEVRGFLAELDTDAVLPAKLTELVAKLGRPTERLIGNLGSLVASYRRADLIKALLDVVPKDVGLQFDVAKVDLSESEWRGRLLLGVSFVDCVLDRARFDDCAIAELSLTRTSVDGAEFRGSTVESLVLSGGARIFGTPDAYEALTELGAECGLTEGRQVTSLRQARREQVVRMVHDRLYRFYRPGQQGPEGSRWDSSIKENNLFGGVAPKDRKFAKKKLVPALRWAGLITPRRAHGEVIYDLDNDGEDDARALIERNEVCGRVAAAVDALT